MTNPVLLQLLITVFGVIANGLFALWFFRLRKREEAPWLAIKELKKKLQEEREEREQDLRIMNELVVGLRGDVKYLQGKMNGKGWST